MPDLVGGDLEYCRIRPFWSWEEIHIWEIERVTRRCNFLAVASIQLVDSKLLKSELWASLWLVLGGIVASSVELRNFIVVRVEKETFGLSVIDIIIRFTPSVFRESPVHPSLFELDQYQQVSTFIASRVEHLYGLPVTLEDIDRVLDGHSYLLEVAQQFLLHAILHNYAGTFEKLCTADGTVLCRQGDTGWRVRWLVRRRHRIVIAVSVDTLLWLLIPALRSLLSIRVLFFGCFPGFDRSNDSLCAGLL